SYIAVTSSAHDTHCCITSSMCSLTAIFFFSSRRRHTRSYGDWSSDVCSSDLRGQRDPGASSRRFPGGRFRRADASLPCSDRHSEIGRASCRERGEISGGGGAVERSGGGEREWRGVRSVLNGGGRVMT